MKKVRDMSESSDFKSIEQLAASVKGNVDELTNGTLSVEEIEMTVSELRELYERLVVIRHKAFEEREKPEDAVPKKEVEVEQEKEDTPQGTGSLFKLDIDQPIEEKATPKNQVSLIDQIEELGDESLNDKVAEEVEGSLAEKLEGGSIDDLKKAIALNQKFWFIRELFNDNKELFEKALKELDNAEDHVSAQKWFDVEVRVNLKDDHDETALRKFLELLERRFLADA